MDRKLLRVISQIPRVDESELPTLKSRMLVVFGILALTVAVLTARLWWLQIYQGPENRLRSERNRTRIQQLPPPRGNILDRRGRPLVTNRPCFNVVWTRDDAPVAEQEPVRRRLAELLAVDISTLLERAKEADHLPKYTPVILAEDIDWQALARIENRRFLLPGIRIQAMPRRKYLYGDLASHLLGYLGRINDKELAARAEEGYGRHDQIGKRGLERQFETVLRGEKGQRYLEVDARGFEQKVLGVRPPLPGADLTLTMDIDLQQAAEKALEGKAGAVVAMEVTTGRVLVLASAPPMPVDRFVGAIPASLWQEIVNDPKKPQFNRAVQGAYPPGSTYKIITALAGLNEGVITPKTVFYCNGAMKLGNRRFSCWKRTGHGSVNLRRALAESCDVYFYQVGLRLGIDRLARYARSFGLGAKSGIELEGERSGIVPSPEWKWRARHERWQDGDTLNTAIGQGATAASPLQICMMTAAVANGGTVFRPQLVERITGADGHPLRTFTPQVIGEVAGDHRWLQPIRRALVDVVNTRHGTGGNARLDQVLVAGKTGTSQVYSLKGKKSPLEEELPYKLRDHAWFTCFAPAERPEIAVTVVVEHGGHGGAAAAPIAKQVLQRYFSSRQDPAAPATGDRRLTALQPGVQP